MKSSYFLGILKLMYTINRAVAIIKPKQPYIDWANKLPDAKGGVSFDDFQDDCLAVLIAKYDTDQRAKEHINKMWKYIFEDELMGWSTNMSWWPKKRTKKMFWQWFDVKFHSVVIDPCKMPIKMEEL